MEPSVNPGIAWVWVCWLWFPWLSTQLPGSHRDRCFLPENPVFLMQNLHWNWLSLSCVPQVRFLRAQIVIVLKNNRLSFNTQLKGDFIRKFRKNQPLIEHWPCIARTSCKCLKKCDHQSLTAHLKKTFSMTFDLHLGTPTNTWQSAILDWWGRSVHKEPAMQVTASSHCHIGRNV